MHYDDIDHRSLIKEFKKFLGLTLLFRRALSMLIISLLIPLFSNTINSSRTDFRFCGKSNIHVWNYHGFIDYSCFTVLHDFVVISCLYSMLISEFSFPISKNRFAVAALFFTRISCMTDHVRSWQGLERNIRILLNLLSEILLIVWNLEPQELK